MNTSSHEKLAIQRHIQSDEENRLMNQIHGLEMQKEQAQADILQKLSSNGEELNING